MASFLVKQLTDKFKNVLLCKPIVQSCSIHNQIRNLGTKSMKNVFKFPKNVTVDKGKPIEIDRKQPQMYFENSKELQTTDNENIKKIFSLEYATENDFKHFEETLIKKKFSTDELDSYSHEADIALHTVRIRRFSKILDENPQNKRLKFMYYRAVYRRDRLLAELRQANHERYLWVKNELGLEWEPLDEPERRSTRYGRFKSEVKAVARHERNEKLKILKESYDNQKPEFFKMRDEEFQKIFDDIKSLEIPDANLKQLKNIIEKAN